MHVQCAKKLALDHSVHIDKRWQNFPKRPSPLSPVQRLVKVCVEQPAMTHANEQKSQQVAQHVLVGLGALWFRRRAVILTVEQLRGGIRGVSRAWQIVVGCWPL